MKRDDFTFDQEFRDNLAGASAQQTSEGGSWKDNGIALAKIVGITLAATVLDAFLFGATGVKLGLGDMALCGSTGWYVFGPGSPSSASPARSPTANAVSTPNRP